MIENHEGIRNSRGSHEPYRAYRVSGRTGEGLWTRDCRDRTQGMDSQLPEGRAGWDTGKGLFPERMGSPPRAATPSLDGL